MRLGIIGRFLAVTIHMSRCNVIVTGASAGGVGSLIQLVGGLPADLNAAVAAVLHVPEESPSALPVILARSGPLPAAHAIDNEPLEHGRIYVAPPDRHLLVKRRSVRVVVGPNENRHRPAAAGEGGRWVAPSRARRCGSRVRARCAA